MIIIKGLLDSYAFCTLCASNQETTTKYDLITYSHKINFGKNNLCIKVLN